MLVTLLKVVVAVAAAWVMIRVGIAFLRGFARPMGEAPPPGELRKVRLRYRCPLCGMELRVEQAAAEDPLPPRHCMEEMDLIQRLDT